MRIGIDVRPLQTAHRGAGIGTYTFNLVKHLLSMEGADEWLLYTRRGCALEVDFPLPRQLPGYRPRQNAHVAMWEQLFLPIDILRGRVDLFHATGGLTQVWEICAPYIQPARTVVTVQDLHPLILPHFHFIAAARAFKWQMKALKKAARLIAVSENTKRDIIRFLEIPPERIEVIHMAAGEHFQVLDGREVDAILSGYNLRPPYVLYVGNYNVHKNIEILIEAWGKTSPSVPLVLVGKRESYPQTLIDRIVALGRADQVRFIGGVDGNSRTLVALYNAASVFVFPSLYEGFGLPVVEAMQCGCPVIASRRGSLPEVVGEAGQLVEPDDVPGLADEIQRILDDAEWRETLRARGFEQVRKFSWRQAAKKTLAVYHAAAGV